MHVLLVLAHPEPASYNAELARLAADTLREQGHIVEISDLYAQQFNPVAGPADFTFDAASDGFFDLQAAQRQAVATGGFAADIAAEQAKLRRADLLLLQFPLWWHGVPAILKGWFDRVLAAGWAYGGGQALAGKRALVCVTAGAPNAAWDGAGRPTIEHTLAHVLHGTLAFCGMHVLPLQLIGGAKRHGPAEKATVLAAYAQRLRTL